MKRILIFADYFGKAPAWIELFLLSCAYNPTINWVIRTDCIPPHTAPPNVRVEMMTPSDYNARVSERLSIRFSPDSMYNICSIRPAIADIFHEDIVEFDYFGWCDVDVIFGRLREFLNETVLNRDLISMSDRICTGHFTLLRNCEKMRTMYRAIPKWQSKMEYAGIPEWTDSLDEAWLSRLSSPYDDLRKELISFGVPITIADMYRGNNMFKQMFVTPFVPEKWRDRDYLHPEVWYWHRGMVTNADERQLEYPYLHLMNFKARRYINEQLYGLCPVWADCERPMGNDLLAATLAAGGIRIDRTQIYAISEAERDAQIAEFRRAKMAGYAAGAYPDDVGEAIEEARKRGVDIRVDEDGICLVDFSGVLDARTRSLLWYNSRVRL